MQEDKEVKINLSCKEALRTKLKEIAKGKGMQFHAYLNVELEKIAKRSGK